MRIKKLLSSALLIIFVFALSFIIASPVNAGWVSGYYRRDGTYINSYYRSRPNAYTYDNYSYRSPSYSNGYGYNNSYYSSRRSYSSRWYTPSYLDSDYYYGYSLYDWDY